MPPKKRPPPEPKNIPPKETFFAPKSSSVVVHAPKTANNNKPTPAFAEQQHYHRQPMMIKPRRFVYDEDTGEPYAEWINGEAVCLQTGDVLFESRSLRFDADHDAAFMQQQQPLQKFDFTVPNKGTRHPLDPTIFSQSLIDSNVISLNDLRDGKAGITFQVYTDFIGRAAT